MKKLVVFSWFLFCILPAAAQAAEYPAGSIGYVYERCQADLKDSKTPEAFHKTYCSNFIAGAYVSAYWTGLGYMVIYQNDDPCNSEIKKIVDNVADKACALVSKHTQNLPEKLELLFVFLQSVLDFIRDHKQQEDFLALPVTSFWTEFYKMKDRFCPAYKSDEIEKAIKDFRNNYVHFDQKKPFGTDIPYKSLYQQCVDDIKKSFGDESVFKTTLCGAQIEGFMMNAFASVKYEVDRNKVSENCHDNFDSIFMFKSDVPTEYCILKDESRIRIAQTFLEYMDANCKEYQAEGKSCDAQKFEFNGMVAPMVFEDKRWTCAAGQKGGIK